MVTSRSATRLPLTRCCSSVDRQRSTPSSSPTAGVLNEILVPEGETVEVGAVRPGSVTPPRMLCCGPGRRGTRIAAARAEPAAEPEPPAEPEPAAEARARAEQAARQSPLRPSPRPRARPLPAPAASAADGDGSAAPPVAVVRRIITEHNIDHRHDHRAHRAGGRITATTCSRSRSHRRDALRRPLRLRRSGRARAAAPAPAAPRQLRPRGRPSQRDTDPRARARARARSRAGSRAGTRSCAGTGGHGARDEIAFNNIRKRTAEHMVRSKANLAPRPHRGRGRLRNVDRVRVAAKDEFRAAEGVALTYLPFISRPPSMPCASFPGSTHRLSERARGSPTGQPRVRRRPRLRGPMVAVVHNADDKAVAALAVEVADLAARARLKKWADEITGGTFTLTNLGSTARDHLPVINQPQVAILSHAVVRKKQWSWSARWERDHPHRPSVGTLAMRLGHVRSTARMRRPFRSCARHPPDARLGPGARVSAGHCAVRWGPVPYREAHDLQKALFETRPTTICLLLENPTSNAWRAGRHGQRAGAAGVLGAELWPHRSGCDVTYQGPGQLVVYPS